MSGAGTFNQSAVGFGTIVGSAVFNVLFVIGTCAVASKDALQLTWWPLARDCSCYCISLFAVAMLFGKVAMKPYGDGQAYEKYENFCYWREDREFAKPQDCAAIHHWEAGILLVMYAGYCTVMGFNQQLAQIFVSKKPDASAADDSVPNPVASDDVKRGASNDYAVTAADAIKHSSEYRAGLWTVLMEERSLAEQVRLTSTCSLASHFLIQI